MDVNVPRTVPLKLPKLILSTRSFGLSGAGAESLSGWVAGRSLKLHRVGREQGFFPACP